MIRAVDASAIAALVFGEPEKPWVQVQITQAQLIAPTLLDFELGNICRKKLRRFPDQSAILLAAWRTWCTSSLITTEPSDPMQVIGLATTHDLTFYDASYLALAQARNADLITLDTHLARTARRLGLHAPTLHTTPRSRN